MTPFGQSGICANAIQELRARASRDADVPELVESLVAHLGLPSDRALFPVLIHFQAAFCLSLRDVLPLREWLAGQDRSEIDSRLIPAMQRTRNQWQLQQLQKA